MRFSTLASGSKANAILVEHGSTLILVDCGLSLRQLNQRLEALGARLAEIDAVLITHEHRDHVNGLPVLVNTLGIKPYMSLGTAIAMGLSSSDFVRAKANTSFVIDGIEVTPITVPHDVREPLMYSFNSSGASLVIATDFGLQNDYLVESFSRCSAIVLESNYDDLMLNDNIKYPPHIKQRIRSNYGHLSNEQAGKLLSSIVHQGLHTVVAAHISENNNRPEHVLAALSRVLKNNNFTPKLYAANQHKASPWFEVQPQK